MIHDSLTEGVAYGVIAPWPQTARGTGFTIELVDPDSDNSMGQNWQGCASSVRGNSTNHHQ